MALAAQTLVLLRKKGERRIATLIDSPYLPEGEALFTIGANGIANAYTLDNAGEPIQTH